MAHTLRCFLLMLSFTFHPVASASEEEFYSAEDFKTLVDEYAQWLSIKCLQILPMTMGILTQVALDSMIGAKQHPYLHKLTSRLMIALNAGLAAPVISPLVSLIEKKIHSLSAAPNEEDNEQSSAELPAYLGQISARSNQKYTKQERASRDTIYEALTFANTAFRNTQEALDAGHAKRAVANLADFALRLRLLFEDLSPSDPFLARTAQVYLNAEWDMAQLKNEALKIIAKMDTHWQEQEVQNYYEVLFDSWFPNLSMCSL